MKLIDHTLRSLFNRIGKQRCETFVAWLARLAPVDLLTVMYHSRGIHNYQNLEVSGELHLIQKELPNLIKRKNPIFFDVGANIGEFSLSLRSQFPEAAIFAFEPIPATFSHLSRNTENKSIKLLNYGLGDRTGILNMYRNSSDPTSPLATLHEGALAGPSNGGMISTIPVTIKTVDDISKELSIPFIDFLKNDTEGHELAVLQGATTMIQENKIGCILFEFNSMNIASRVFLSDFYNLLPGYRFYRIDTQRLISLGAYSPRNEIFEFQNILAVNTNIHK